MKIYLLIGILYMIVLISWRTTRILIKYLIDDAKNHREDSMKTLITYLFYILICSILWPISAIVDIIVFIKLRKINFNNTRVD